MVGFGVLLMMLVLMVGLGIWGMVQINDVVGKLYKFCMQLVEVLVSIDKLMVDSCFQVLLLLQYDLNFVYVVMYDYLFDFYFKQFKVNIVEIGM